MTTRSILGLALKWPDRTPFLSIFLNDRGVYLGVGVHVIYFQFPFPHENTGSWRNLTSVKLIPSSIKEWFSYFTNERIKYASFFHYLRSMKVIYSKECFSLRNIQLWHVMKNRFLKYFTMINIIPIEEWLSYCTNQIIAHAPFNSWSMKVILHGIVIYWFIAYLCSIVLALLAFFLNSIFSILSSRGIHLLCLL